MKIWRNDLFDTYKFSDHCTNKLFYCVLLRINGWFEKIQLNVITWKGRFLQSSKHERYYSCRLHVCKQNLQWFWKKNLGKKPYIIVSRSIWELSKYVSWNVWTWPCSQASSYKKHQSKSWSFNSYWYVINDKKRYQRNNISHCLSICEI